MRKCDDRGHDYVPANKSPYYKRSEDGESTGLGLPKHDQSIAYLTLFCTKCGNTREIVACNHRRSTNA